eukprot:8861292-Prorocentrum_lima.AAC.1
MLRTRRALARRGLLEELLDELRIVHERVAVVLVLGADPIVSCALRVVHGVLLVPVEHVGEQSERAGVLAGAVRQLEIPIPIHFLCIAQ